MRRLHVAIGVFGLVGVGAPPRSQMGIVEVGAPPRTLFWELTASLLSKAKLNGLPCVQGSGVLKISPDYCEVQLLQLSYSFLVGGSSLTSCGLPRHEGEVGSGHAGPRDRRQA